LAKIILGHKIIFMYNIVLILHEVIKDMDDEITIRHLRMSNKKRRRRTNIKFTI